jgi:hypothetical protein
MVAPHGNMGIPPSGGIIPSGISGQADVPWGGCIASHKVLGASGCRRDRLWKGGARP